MRCIAAQIGYPLLPVFPPPSKMASSLLALALFSPVLAGVHEVWWNITYVEDVNPDGLFDRRVIGVNNTWP